MDAPHRDRQSQRSGDAVEGTGSRHLYVVFAGLVLVMLLAALDSTIVSTALPTIVGELGGFDQHFLGRDRLPAGSDDRDAAVREARRPVRAQDRAAGRSRGVPDRLGALRARAEHAGADRVPRHPGTRRRRADGLGAGGDRGRRAATRPRPLPGHLRRGVRPLERGRAADRWLLHHAPVLAVDLLHQHPARDRRIRRARIHPAVGDDGGYITRSTIWAPGCSPRGSARSCC